MSWSYDSAALEVALNWVRLRIGDTQTTDQLLTDEELLSLISLHDDKKAAAVEAAQAISAKYRRWGANAEAESYLRLAADIAADGKPEYL